VAFLQKFFSSPVDFSAKFHVLTESAVLISLTCLHLA